MTTAQDALTVQLEYLIIKRVENGSDPNQPMHGSVGYQDQ